MDYGVTFSLNLREWHNHIYVCYRRMGKGEVGLVEEWFILCVCVCVCVCV